MPADFTPMILKSFLLLAVLGATYFNQAWAANPDSLNIGRGYRLEATGGTCSLRKLPQESGELTYRSVDCDGTETPFDAGISLVLALGNHRIKLESIPADFIHISEPIDLDGNGLLDLHVAYLSGGNLMYPDGGKHHLILQESGRLRMIPVPVSNLTLIKQSTRARPLMVGLDALNTCDDNVHGEPLVEYVIRFSKGNLVLDKDMTLSKGPLLPSRLDRLRGVKPKEFLAQLKREAVDWEVTHCAFTMFDAEMAYRGFSQYQLQQKNGRVLGIEHRPGASETNVATPPVAPRQFPQRGNPPFLF